MRVAILGGGMAGLAAAWALTDPASSPDVESVTVYQRGWRLGGKGASSRGAHGRIEEHGLHVWLGYYDNAFRLIRQVYEELDRPTTARTCPIRTWRDGFVRAGRVGVADQADGRWDPWVAAFTEDDEEPGGDPSTGGPLTVPEFVRRCVRLLLDLSSSLGRADPRRTAPPGVVLSASRRRPGTGGGPGEPFGSLADVADLTRRAEITGLVAAVIVAELVGTAGRREPLARAFVDHLDRLRAELADRLRGDERARRLLSLAELVAACARGALADGLLTHPAGFAAIDHLDFREWLSGHAASPDAVTSPLVRGMYDLVFAYERGDPGRPRFAAGLGLFLASKLFFEYRGGIFWKMRAGMGDVVFAPLYEALRARGVRFEFFHRVDGLHLAADRRSVATVTLTRQARLVPGLDTYEPLVPFGGLPCFPARPRQEQLATAPAGNPESRLEDPSREDRVTLTAGQDFDGVVLAVSLGMVPHVCAELVADSARWRRMVSGVATVATQGLQLWLRSSEAELGWPHDGATVSGYALPFQTYASMSHLLPREDWPDDNTPGAVAYLCSSLREEDAGHPGRARAAVRRNAREFLERHGGSLWPQAVDGRGFRWDLLAGDGDASGPDRLDGQFLTANVDPSDRYVQSLPGTARYRLRADESGYGNLVLAGDWTNNGLNAGCIEAAVMAGRQAANALLGRPLLDGITGSWYGIEPTRASLVAQGSAAR